MPRVLRPITQTLVVCLIVIIGASILYAWSGPTASPPAGNAPAPINTGGSSQLKTGGLTVNGDLTANSQFCLGGDCRSSWPSGGGGADGYLPDDPANSGIDMNNNNIRNTRNLYVDSIFKNGSGEIELWDTLETYYKTTFWDDVEMWGELCLSGVCRNSWPSGGGSGGDGYLPDDPATSDVDMDSNDIRDVLELEVIRIKEGVPGIPIKFKENIDLEGNSIQDTFNINTERISDPWYGDGIVELRNSLWVKDDLNVAGSKNFVQPIKDTNKEVVYTSSESGEAIVEWTDSMEVDRDGTFVEFPTHLKHVISDSEDYHVLVTPIKSLNDVGIFEKKDDGFLLKSEGQTKVDFHVRGVRKGYEDKQIIRESENKATN